MNYNLDTIVSNDTQNIDEKVNNVWMCEENVKLSIIWSASYMFAHIGEENSSGK